MAVTWLLPKLIQALHELCCLSQQHVAAPLPGAMILFGDRRPVVSQHSTTGL